MYNKDTVNKIFEQYKNMELYNVRNIETALIHENVKYYEIFVKLYNSINNAGWEQRHSEHIEMINQVMYNICDEYEDFLP